MADISKIKLENTSYNIKDETARTDISSLDTRVTALENADSPYNPSRPADMNKVIIIGDSYASREDNWVTPLVAKLGLGAGEYYKSAIGSSGFYHQGQQNKTFLTLLTDVTDTLNTAQKAEISHVIVCGGANDNTHTEAQIDNAIETFVTTVNSTLPNAKTMIGEICWTSITSDIINYSKVVDVYSKCTKYNKCYYLNNVQYTLHNYNLLLSDQIHPTQAGNTQLAANIHQAIMTGYCDVIYTQLKHKLNENDELQTYFECLNNNMTIVYTNRPSYKIISVSSLTANGRSPIELTGDILQYAKGSYFETNRTFVVANINVNGTRRDIPCTVGVYEGKIKVYPLLINSTGGYETLTNITQLWLPQFQIIMNSLHC